MALVAKTQIGGYRVAESQVVVCRPERLRRDGTDIGMIALHGHDANSYQMYADIYTGHFVRPLCEMGIVYMSIDAGGLHPWGNPDAQDSVLDAYDWLRAEFDIAAKAHILGMSMNGPLALAMGRLNKGLFRSVTLIEPAVKFSDHVADFGAEMQEAWGGASDWRTTVAAPYDPTPRAQAHGDEFADLPTKMWHASNDTVVPTASQLAYLALCPSMESINMGAVGHSPVAVTALDMATWVKSNS